MTVAHFRGEVLCGAAWFGHDFGGLRVAVIAPGREAAQIVPEVLATARTVRVFQEEPDWILPMRVPGGRAVRVAVARAYLRSQVKDPWVRRLLTPDPRFGSRRLAVSPGYFAALRRPNCKLITWPVYAITEESVRTAEGVEHQVDCIVLGTHSPFAASSAAPTVTAEGPTT